MRRKGRHPYALSSDPSPVSGHLRTRSIELSLTIKVFESGYTILEWTYPRFDAPVMEAHPCDDEPGPISRVHEKSSPESFYFRTVKPGIAGFVYSASCRSSIEAKILYARVCLDCDSPQNARTSGRTSLHANHFLLDQGSCRIGTDSSHQIKPVDATGLHNEMLLPLHQWPPSFLPITLGGYVLFGQNFNDFSRTY